MQQPAGDVIHQDMRIGRDAQHGAAMRTAHRNTMKMRAYNAITNIDLIERAMRDRLFTFGTVTVT